MIEKQKRCKLCNKKQADKKGSHIVPHFLLKRIENIDGKLDRGYEIGFVINSLDIKPHFGRSVSRESLDLVFGELTDEEIHEFKHPLIVDNLFCKDCENKIAKIENEYANTLKKTDEKVYSSGIRSELGFLFWASIIWRISLINMNGFSLSKQNNEILRRVLARTLRLDVKEIKLESIGESKDVKKISYKLIRCPNFSDKESTYMILHPFFRYPYSLIIDEYILLFSFNNNYNDFMSKSLFGIQEEVQKIPTNNFYGNEQIYPLSYDKMLSISNLLINHMTELRLIKLNRFWDKLHIGIGGKGPKMPEHIKREIFDELTNQEKKLGRKLNTEDLKNSTFKVLKKLIVK